MLMEWAGRKYFSPSTNLSFWRDCWPGMLSTGIRLLVHSNLQNTMLRTDYFFWHNSGGSSHLSDNSNRIHQEELHHSSVWSRRMKLSFQSWFPHATVFVTKNKVHKEHFNAGNYLIEILYEINMSAIIYYDHKHHGSLNCKSNHFFH